MRDSRSCSGSGIDGAAECWDGPRAREVDGGGITVGSGGGGTMTSECWDGVRGDECSECFDGERPMAETLARAGAADDIAGWSWRSLADVVLSYRLFLRRRRKNGNAIKAASRGNPRPTPTPMPACADFESPPDFSLLLDPLFVLLRPVVADEDCAELPVAAVSSVPTDVPLVMGSVVAAVVAAVLLVIASDVSALVTLVAAIVDLDVAVVLLVVLALVPVPVVVAPGKPAGGT